MSTCIPLGSLNRVPALIGWGKGGNVTSAGWQVILCDPIWHVSSRSGVVLVAQTAMRFLSASRDVPVYAPAFAGTKLYCLVTEAHAYDQLAQCCYLTARQLRLKLATVESVVRCLSHRLIKSPFRQATGRRKFTGTG